MPLRNRILILAVLVSAITYLDRACLSAAAPVITRELGLNDIQMGTAFSVFALAYGVFEIPMGWLGDRLGQRRMLTRIVACWSAFTMLTGMVWSYVGLIAVRFGFGAAEAGAFPSIARTLARWFHAEDRARVNGLMWGSARIGAAVAPPLAILLIGCCGWRLTFSIFGLVGALWCIAFWRLHRDEPVQHPAASATDLAYARAAASAETESIAESVPWKRMLVSGNLWALFWMYFATSYGFWFLLTWLPTYLIRQYGLSLERSSFYAALPLAVGAASCVGGGAISDWLVRRTGSLRWGRRFVGLTGYLLAATGFAAASAVHQALAAVLFLMVAEIGLDLATPVAWAACLEVGGRFGGTATAFMNTASSISAFISPLAAVWLLAKYGSFNAMLLSAGLVYLFASFLWLRIDAGERISR